MAINYFIRNSSQLFKDVATPLSLFYYMEDLKNISPITNGEIIEAYDMGRQIMIHEHNIRVDGLESRNDGMLIPVPAHISRPSPYRMERVLEGKVSRAIISALYFVYSQEAIDYLRSCDPNQANPILMELLKKWHQLFLKNTGETPENTKRIGLSMPSTTDLISYCRN